MYLNYIEVWKRSLDVCMSLLFGCLLFYQRPSKLGPCITMVLDALYSSIFISCLINFYYMNIDNIYSGTNNILCETLNDILLTRTIPFQCTIDYFSQC